MCVTMYLCDKGTSSRTVRHMVREMLISEGLFSEDVSDIEAILGELCTNVERHGRSMGGKYLLEVKLYLEKISIKVEDWGKGFDFSYLPDPNADGLDNMTLAGTERDDGFGDLRLGGWGIPTVQKLSNSVTYAKTIPTGTTVHVEKHITYSNPNIYIKTSPDSPVTPSPFLVDHGLIDTSINLSSQFLTGTTRTTPKSYKQATA